MLTSLDLSQAGTSTAGENVRCSLAAFTPGNVLFLAYANATIMILQDITPELLLEGENEGAFPFC